MDCENANRVRWRGPRTNLIFDVDGTLSGTNVPTYIAPYYKHYDSAIADGKCTRVNEKYEDSVLCTGTRLRGVMFRNHEKKENFMALDLRIHDVNANVEFTNNLPVEYFSTIPTVLIKDKSKDGKDSYAGVFATGYLYNIHWLDGVDWTHMMVVPPYYS